jgi:hypothetical protein
MSAVGPPINVILAVAMPVPSRRKGGGTTQVFNR